MTELDLQPSGSRPTTALDVRTAFLAGHHSPRTAEAYGRDLTWWFDCCAAYDLDPLAAHRFHIDQWVTTLLDAELRPATIQRMVSTVRNYYAWAVEQEIIAKSPMPAKGRSLHLPKVSSKSQTLGPDREEAKALYFAARARSPRDYALVSLLLHQGLRASEACGLDREHMGTERGHRTLLVHRKGGEDQRMAIAPVAAVALDEYLAGRDDREAPLFLAGERARSYPRMTRQQIADVITACASRAGITKRLSPHSLRHTCATQLLDQGVPLRDVQVFLGHASPTTTQRYDLGRDQLDRSPAYALSGVFS